MAMWIKDENGNPLKVKAVFKSKNLIPFPYFTDSIELGGVAITVNNDGTITLNGECTEAFWFVLRNKSENPPYMIEAGTYTLSGTTQDGMVLYITDNTKQINHYNWSNIPVTFTFDEQQALYMQIRGYAGHTFDNVVLKPMLNKGTTPLPYEPYFPLTKFKAIPKSRNLLNIPEEFTWTRYKAINITLPAGNYTVSMDSFVAGGNSSPSMLFHNIDTNKEDASFWFGANEKQITLTGGEYSIRFYSNGNYPNSEGVTSTINKLMLNKGETALPYEPPQEIWL